MTADRATGGPATSGLAEVAAERAVVICCGPGGVGKTTVSAAIAVAAATAGRRACVVTVDPARRLANALGVDTLANEAAVVEGPWSGRLQALMLDSKGTFDDLVHRYARTPEQADSILANRLYQSLAGALSGTQEYIAMEKLYELTESDDHDVVVVDTPPTRNALELLDAPTRLTHFLSNRLFRALLMPTRAYLKAVGFATQALLRTIAKVAGAEIVQDAVTFFQAFQGMEEGFRTRASVVRELLTDPSTAYVLVTSPREDSVEEASYFAGKLSDTGVEPAGVVVNRVHPHFIGEGSGGGGDGGARAAEVPEVPDVAPGTPLSELVTNLAQLETVAAREDQVVQKLVGQVGSAPVARIPLLDRDVHDLDGLQAVARRLVSPGSNEDLG